MHRTKLLGQIVCVDDVLKEADQMLAGAHGHGVAKKNKKRKPFMSVALHKDARSKRATSNLHKRRRKRKRRPQTKSLVDHQPQGLSDQQKQDLFLKYNPDFQRWPRFADNDQEFHEMMRRRALDDRRRYYRNFHKQLKREETSSLETTASSETEQSNFSSEAASTATSETTAQNAELSSETESSSVTGSEEALSSSMASETVSSMASVSSVEESQTAEGVTQSTGDLLTGLDQASLTLPQAAQNILQTANSDIFENTTVPEVSKILL